jgi:hypothetical protein
VMALQLLVVVKMRGVYVRIGGFGWGCGRVYGGKGFSGSR